MARPLAEVLKPLTSTQQAYVSGLLRGLSKRAAAAAAGQTSPARFINDTNKSVAVQEALDEARAAFAEEVEFSRRDAHDMLIDAHKNAETATEQVAAVRELIKLHGIAAPEKHEHAHHHDGQIDLSALPDAELKKLAKLDEDFMLDGEFEVVTEAGANA